MNRELVIAWLRQRLTSPMRVVLLALAFFFPLLMVLFVPGAPLGLLGANATQFALILAAGMIGQDVSAGVLQLVFARPVARHEYVFSRWAAAAAGAAALMVLQVAIVSALAALRGHPHEFGESGLFALESALHAIGIVSVMTLFSALVPGLADLGVLLVAGFTGTLLSTIGQSVHTVAFLSRIGEEMSHFVSPEVPLASLATGSPIPWYAIASYLSTITLCLGLAIVAMNRKELSYAAG